jgi:hypothetical protein
MHEKELIISTKGYFFNLLMHEDDLLLKLRRSEMCEAHSVASKRQTMGKRAPYEREPQRGDITGVSSISLY